MFSIIQMIFLYPTDFLAAIFLSTLVVVVQEKDGVAVLLS